MSARRASLLTALLLTAALLCAMPGIFSSFQAGDANRMDERLRPARARTLTVWLISDRVDDRRLVSELCSSFERLNEGMRVFLRRVDAAELMEENAVKPDIVLHATASLVNPEQLFLPLTGLEKIPEDALASGKSGGTPYAAPLWYAPNVLSLPAAWALGDEAPEPSAKPSSFFDLGTPAPDAAPEEGKPYLTEDELPWDRLLQKGALALPAGVALQQVQFLAPATVRAELAAACAGEAAAECARVQTLGAYLSAVRAGGSLIACPLLPAVCDRVRYLSLCRDSGDARALAAFLLSDHAQSAAVSHSLLPVCQTEVAADALTSALLERFKNGLLFPNAFAHTLEELEALCSDAFFRAADPVETLLRLR